MGKLRTNLQVEDAQLLAEMKAGKSTRELAKECGVSPGTIRNRLREHDKKTYTRISSQRISPKSDGQRKELGVSGAKLHRRWKNGESIKDLAEKHHVSRQTIIRRLQEYDEKEYREMAHSKIAKSIEERRKNITATPEQLLEQFKKGESTATLGEKYHVSRQTIARTLVNHNKDTYQEIVKERITNASIKESLIPIGELKKRWENGERAEALENASGLSYRAILEKLKRQCGEQYKESLERRTKLRRNQNNVK